MPEALALLASGEESRSSRARMPGDLRQGACEAGAELRGAPPSVSDGRGGASRDGLLCSLVRAGSTLMARMAYRLRRNDDREPERAAASNSNAEACHQRRQRRQHRADLTIKTSIVSSTSSPRAVVGFRDRFAVTGRRKTDVRQRAKPAEDGRSHSLLNHLSPSHPLFCNFSFFLFRRRKCLNEKP
jgi:hypothetical protein